MSPTQRLAPGEFRIRSLAHGDHHVVILEGELDLAVAPELEAELRAAERMDAAQIVLDLSDLTFIDSTGIALLIDAVKRSQRNANRLRVRRSQADGVRRVLAMTGIDERLPYLD